MLVSFANHSHALFEEPIEPDENDLIATNATCIHLNLSSWNNGACPISHFSIEHRPLGDIRWTVVSSDISNSDENRESLVFCDFQPATWYQLKMSASNDAGRTLTTLNFATTNMAGERIAVPQLIPGFGNGGNGAGGTDYASTGMLGFDQYDWMMAFVVSLIGLAAVFMM